MAKILNDVGQISRMHVLQQLVRDVKTYSTLRIGFQDVAELPGDGFGRNPGLKLTNHRLREHTSQHATQNGPDADIHFEDVQDLLLVFPFPQEGNIIHPDYFTAMNVDDLLVKKITNHA